MSPNIINCSTVPTNLNKSANKFSNNSNPPLGLIKTFTLMHGYFTYGKQIFAFRVTMWLEMTFSFKFANFILSCMWNTAMKIKAMALIQTYWYRSNIQPEPERQSGMFQLWQLITATIW
jgi:hypothetical protein